MVFYRSYKKADAYKTTYSYTSCEVGGNNPFQTSAYTINNSSFNSPLVIGNNVVNLANMLRNCTNFNCDLTLPTNVMDCSDMMRNCTNFGRNIYIKNNLQTMFGFENMLNEKNKLKRTNIYCRPTLNIDMLNKICGYYWTGSNWYTVDFTTMTNGLYNSEWNIYVYTNYSG